MLEPRYVDNREPGERKAALVRAGFIPVTLESGDVAFPEAGGSTVLIEHKTVSLLLANMADGVMTRQARRLCEATPFPILLIEGAWQHSNGSLLGSGYTWEQVWNYLQTLQDWGLRLQLSTGPQHTLERIFSLAEYYAQEIHHSAERHPSGDLWVTALSLVYGIERKKSEALLEAFGTLEAIVDATPTQLTDAKGIGPILAQRIHSFWRVRPAAQK